MTDFGVETAEGRRGPGTFPQRWIERGVLPSGEGDAAIAGWIRAMITEDEARGVGREQRERRRARQLADLRFDAARLAVVIERLERRGSP